MSKSTILKIITGSLLLIGVGIILYLAYRSIKGCWKRYRLHPLKNAIVIVGVVLTLVCVGIYYLSTINVDQADNALVVKDTTFYIEDGLFSNTHYIQYFVKPTDYTLPNKTYRVDVSNGIAGWSDKLYWSQLELDIVKPKIVKHKISEDEYNALAKMPYYNVTIKEVKSENNYAVMMLPLAYIGLVILALLIKHERETNRDKRIIPMAT